MKHHKWKFRICINLIFWCVYWPVKFPLKSSGPPSKISYYFYVLYWAGYTEIYNRMLWNHRKCKGDARVGVLHKFSSLRCLFRDIACVKEVYAVILWKLTYWFTAGSGGGVQVLMDLLLRRTLRTNWFNWIYCSERLCVQSEITGSPEGITNGRNLFSEKFHLQPK